MPMQKIDTIHRPRSEAAAAGQLDIFEKQTKRLGDFRDQLIRSENKLVMASLLRDFNTGPQLRSPLAIVTGKHLFQCAAYLRDPAGFFARRHRGDDERIADAMLPARQNCLAQPAHSE